MYFLFLICVMVLVIKTPNLLMYVAYRLCKYITVIFAILE
jgi:hypothetical protein